jgi:uncharacterized protein
LIHTGTSAALLLIINGDILGCSGIMRAWIPLFSMSTTPAGDDDAWKLVFLASFVVATRLTILAMGTDQVLTASTSNGSNTAFVVHALSGLLVGIGTALGGGCTSGHGVCGLARYSLRSIVAVLVFLSTGVAVATTLQNGGGSTSGNVPSAVSWGLGGAVTALGVGAAAVWARQTSKPSPSGGTTSSKTYGAVLTGALFAVGLAISGMTQTAKVKGFLDLSPLLGATTSASRTTWSDYDPTLLTVLGSAVILSWLSYQYINYTKRSMASPFQPLCGSELAIPTTTAVDASLVLGAFSFGLGWGLTGLCPGPALFGAAAGVVPVVVAWLPTFFLGSALGLRLKTFTSPRLKTN